MWVKYFLLHGKSCHNYPKYGRNIPLISNRLFADMKWRMWNQIFDIHVSEINAWSFDLLKFYHNYSYYETTKFEEQFKQLWLLDFLRHVVNHFLCCNTSSKTENYKKYIIEFKEGIILRLKSVIVISSSLHDRKILFTCQRMKTKLLA